MSGMSPFFSWLERVLEIPAADQDFPGVARRQARHLGMPIEPLPRGLFTREAPEDGEFRDGKVGLSLEALVVQRRIAHVARLAWRLRRSAAALADDLARLRATTDSDHS